MRQKKKNERFVKVYSQSSFSTGNVSILVDKQTGVNYLFTQTGYASGLTPLLNRDGTPMVTPMPRTYEE